jgi:hypothetical protein
MLENKIEELKRTGLDSNIPISSSITKKDLI